MTIVNVNYASLDEVFGSDFKKKKRRNLKKLKLKKKLHVITMLEDMIKIQIKI